MRVRPLGKQFALRAGVQLLLLLASGFFIPIAAQFGTSTPREPLLPESNLYVTDYANVVPSDDLKEPNRLLFAFEQRTQIECRIVVVSSTRDLYPDAYAEQLLDDWHIGAKTGKGVLFLIVTSTRAWQIQTTKDLEAELPVTTLNAIAQQVAVETARSNYTAGVQRAAKLLVDELGRSRGLTHEELAREPGPIDPVRTEDASPPPPSIWVFLSLAAGLAVSLMGVVLTFGLGISVLRTIFFWNREGEDHGWSRTMATRAGLFAACAGLIYYFWDDVKFFLGFGRLLGEGVAIFGSCVFPLFALVGFIVLVYFLRYAARFWANYVKVGQQILNKPILIVLGLPLVLLLLPRSEVTILRSWAPVARVTQVGTDSPRLFGRTANSYTVDNFGRVRTLRIEQAQIHNLNELAGLEHLTSLDKLQIKNVSLEGVQDVSSLKSLQSLRFSGTRMSGLEGLDQLERLEELEVENVDVEALHHLGALPKLKTLTLRNCRIADLSVIRRLNTIEMLYLDGSDVTDVSPLSELRNLKLLSIAGTNVTDLSPLRPLPIAAVFIQGTPITEQHLRETFPHLLFVFDQNVEIEEGLLHVEEQFVSPPFKSFRNQILIGLCVAGLVLWVLQSLLRINSYWLFLLRLLFRKTVWGIVVVLIFLTLANLNLPIRVLSSAGLPDPQRLLLSWATFIAIVWLGLRPLLIVLGETKAFSATRWSVLAHYVVRFAPAIALFGPISYKAITNAIPANAYFVLLTGFMFSLVVFGTPWFIVGILMIAGVRNWSRKLHRLRNTATDAGSILEVPLRLTNKNIRFGGLNVVGLTMGPTPEPANAVSRYVITASSLATLSRLPDECIQGVVGSVITISRDDLSNLKKWEVGLLHRWVKNLYFNTISPVWLINDWFDAETSQAGGTRGLGQLQLVLPFLSGSEQRFKMGITVFPLEPAEGIQQCLAANELVPRDHLESFQFKKLLADAFTPVAALLRSLFSQPQLVDRLDVLARVTEVATIFWGLTLISEYEAKHGQFSEADCEKIDSAVKRGFASLPKFNDWISIVGAFNNRGRTDVALCLKHVLDEPPLQLTSLFRLLLEEAAGARFPMRETINKRSQSLELLRHMRNQLTAHGPVTEHTPPDLYKLALLTSLDLLTNLPWSSAVVCKVEKGRCLTYQGLEPRESPATQGLEDGVYLRLATSASGEWMRADKYFKDAGGSIALFIGEKHFFNPLSGLRV